MAEYINREEALNLISDIFFATDPNGEEQCGVIKCSRAIRNAPAADVVEVVRCKNCKHRGKSGLCQAEGQKLTIAKDNHFCSKGERRLDNGSN